MSQQTLLNQIAELTECQLAPIVQDIDQKGIYPEQFMLNLGKIGGYQSVGTVEEGGNGLGLTTQILAIRVWRNRVFCVVSIGLRLVLASK